MEMPVNEMLRDEISRIDHTLIPPGFRGDQREVRAMQDSLSRVIDELGELSAQAQGLNKVITTTEKLRNQPTHTLFLMKDSKANKGRGEVIGFVRVGHKRLYLFDANEETHELEPLCVLDLYVRSNHQRRGNGKKLFDHMLQDQCVQVTQLAIDGPSEKMVSFLNRNYGVKELCRQPYNFAVAPEFFGHKRPQSVGSGSSIPCAATTHGRFSAPKPHSSIATESTASFGRFAARQPHSSMAALIHGGDGGGDRRPRTLQEPGGRHAPAASSGRSNGTSADTPPDVSERKLTPVEAVADAEGASAEGASAEGALDEGASDEGASDNGPEMLRPPSSFAVGAETPHSSNSHAAGVVPRRESQFTEQGYFDIKFYHNKLW